jgi:hypothetical protein
MSPAGQWCRNVSKSNAPNGLARFTRLLNFKRMNGNLQGIIIDTGGAGQGKGTGSIQASAADVILPLTAFKHQSTPGTQWGCHRCPSVSAIPAKVSGDCIG